MPRLSLYRPEKTNDYKFFDRTVREMFTVGGTDLLIHRYIGTNNPVNPNLTEPHYAETSVTNIQDLLFLENRDRKYDPNVYRLRGHYSVANLDFDLSQFGLFLTNDIIFVTVHYNTMIDVIGRKLMTGDVFELPHLTDYHPLNEKIPVSLRRFYQITDANFASEGFSQTWYPHLWRIKCEPLVNSQEFADILQEPINKDNYMGDWDPNKSYEPGYTVTFGDKIYTPIKPVPPGIDPTNKEYWTISNEQNLIDVLSTYNKNIEINQAVIEEAKRIVPLAGYDREQLYLVPTYPNNEPAPPKDVIISSDGPPIGGSLVRSFGLDYNTPSYGIVIPAGSDDSLKEFLSVSLSVVEMAPETTDSGSGPVHGTMVLRSTILGEPITGPYGTSDNTYATADQFVKLEATCVQTPQGTKTIFVETIPKDTEPGLVIRSTVFSSNGTPTFIFPDNTVITKLDFENNIIYVSNSTLGSLPSGTKLEISYNFKGTVSQDMDYRADCDPRFQFIKRSSPRSFGYVNGYLSGTAEAPNGLPVNSGISFPVNPSVGDYFLRIDYLPQQMFRFDGVRWIQISKNVRTEYGFSEGSQTQLARFINDQERTPVSSGGTVPTRQSLSEALRIKPD